MKDENCILAVIKWSTVSADRRMNGVMASNQQAQKRVARQDLKKPSSRLALSFILKHMQHRLLSVIPLHAPQRKIYMGQELASRNLNPVLLVLPSLNWPPGS